MVMLLAGDNGHTQPSGDMDEDLVHCLRRISFMGASSMLMLYFEADLHFWRPSPCRRT
jgi:hypothetical protein